MPLRVHRLAHWLHRHGVPLLPHLLYIFNRIFFTAVIPPETRIGRNVLLGYQGLGIIIHRRAVIGDDVLIGAGVTIGGRSHHEAVPVIENGVMLGTGAKILGPIRIGAHAQIGANAVVLTDVPAHSVAVGVPARVVKSASHGDSAPAHSQ